MAIKWCAMLLQSDEQKSNGWQGVTTLSLTLHSPLKLSLYPKFLLCTLSVPSSARRTFSSQPLGLLAAETQDDWKSSITIPWLGSPLQRRANLLKTDHCARNGREELPFLTLIPTRAVHNVTGATGWQLGPLPAVVLLTMLSRRHFSWNTVFRTSVDHTKLHSTQTMPI